MIPFLELRHNKAMEFHDDDPEGISWRDFGIYF
jgi:hypothetical protein